MRNALDGPALKEIFQPAVHDAVRGIVEGYDGEPRRYQVRAVVRKTDLDVSTQRSFLTGVNEMLVALVAEVETQLDPILKPVLPAEWREMFRGGGCE